MHNHSFLLHTDHTPSPLKRKHTPLIEEEEDEGVSLLPPEEKKIKPDLKREDARYPNHTFISLRYVDCHQYCFYCLLTCVHVITVNTGTM